MKHTGRFLYSLRFLCIILFTGCQKDDVPSLDSRILFSVDLDIQRFDPYTREVYMAAYTSDGKLINYGSLSDSAKWELKGKCRDDKIDILYFEIHNEGTLAVDHFKNVAIGKLFAEANAMEFHSSEYFDLTLKVEDFGNRRENNTSLTFFESIAHDFTRGSGYSGEFEWKLIEDGYAYKTAYFYSDPKYQGHELLIFERGTNEPYVFSIDIPSTDLTPGDTITLKKSDFTPGEVRTILISSSHNEFDNIFLNTYNSINGRRDLITSFDQVIPNPSGEKCIKYIVSDILPINYWYFRYFASSSGSTSYTMRSNKEIPSSIEIKELTGHKITLSGNQFNFTHSNLFPDKIIARSQITFSKGFCNVFTYDLHFDGSETVGSTTINLFEIPHDILSKYTDFLKIDSLDWSASQYSQTYTNLPENSPLDFLKNSRLNWNDNNSSANDYAFEVFTINLYARD